MEGAKVQQLFETWEDEEDVRIKTGLAVGLRLACRKFD